MNSGIETYLYDANFKVSAEKLVQHLKKNKKILAIEYRLFNASHLPLAK